MRSQELHRAAQDHVRVPTRYSGWREHVSVGHCCQPQPKTITLRPGWYCLSLIQASKICQCIPNALKICSQSSQTWINRRVHLQQYWEATASSDALAWVFLVSTAHRHQRKHSTWVFPHGNVHLHISGLSTQQKGSCYCSCNWHTID